MFISQAFAQTATVAADAAAPATSFSDRLLTMAPLLIIFVFFYLLVMRPQSKRMQEHQRLLSTLKKGDQVVTSGGLYGSIVEIEKDDAVLEIAANVRVRVQRASIINMNNTTPTAANDKK